MSATRRPGPTRTEQRHRDQPAPAGRSLIVRGTFAFSSNFRALNRPAGCIQPRPA
jgi:hypothetical protein